MDTKKLLIITWVGMALLIGLGVGYLLGLRGFGQPSRDIGLYGQGGQMGNQQGNMGQQPQQQQGVPQQGAPNQAPNQGSQPVQQPLGR